ncbi:MAG: uridine kinase [Acidobacteriota bacterium]
MERPVLIGIAGGTGSGKTSFAAALIEAVGSANTELLSQDAYYQDHRELSLAERAKINYDHPHAFDTELLLHHLKELKANRPVPKLAYDYASHSRRDTGGVVEPKQILILEGILVLENQRLRRLLDIKLYIDADADVRLLRRLRRDILDRGRTLEMVMKQYLESVRPMHLEFVEPSKRYADLIVPEGAENKVALDMVVARIQAILGSGKEQSVDDDQRE